jgi:hypothetical protein
MQPQPHDVNRQSHLHPGAATLKKLNKRELEKWTATAAEPRGRTRSVRLATRYALPVALKRKAQRGKLGLPGFLWWEMRH